MQLDGDIEVLPMPLVSLEFAPDSLALPETTNRRWFSFLDKEIIESVEAFKIIHAYVLSAEKTARNGRAYSKLFDLACGHGLVGVMFAYAFPTRTVRSFDWKCRRSFYAFAETFEAMRVARVEARWSAESIDWDAEEAFSPTSRFADKSHEAPDAETVDGGRELALKNIKFTLGDLESASSIVDADSFVIALHGCNDANKAAVEMASEKRAAWAIMPCCFKSTLYLPDCFIAKVADDTKYALLCGVMAQKYHAQVVKSIDAKITTRSLVLCGGVDGFNFPHALQPSASSIKRRRSNSTHVS